MSIIDGIKEYIATCPLIKDMGKKLKVDFLSEGNRSFSIEPVPVNPLIRKYVNGSSEMRYVFLFTAKFVYSQEKQMNIENSTFFEDFANWIENNNNKRIFPTLPKGCKASEILVTSSGYLFGISSDMKTGRYQIQITLNYDKEENND